MQARLWYQMHVVFSEQASLAFLYRISFHQTLVPRHTISKSAKDRTVVTTLDDIGSNYIIVISIQTCQTYFKLRNYFIEYALPLFHLESLSSALHVYPWCQPSPGEYYDQSWPGMCWVEAPKITLIVRPKRRSLQSNTAWANCLPGDKYNIH